MGIKSLLLVEDDDATAALEQRILEKQGYGVTRASTGEEALELCHSGLDLVLMDIDLGPGMKGTEAAQIILQTYDVPVAFLSSHTDRATVELTSGITSYGYILKTAGPVVLVASISMVFRLIESQNQERALRRKTKEAEIRYRQLFTLNPLPMWVYEVRSLQFINVNTAAIEQFGYSREEFLSLSVPDILQSDEQERFRSRITELRALNGEYARSGIWGFEKKNGELIQAEVFGHGLDFPSQEARLFVAHDVTEELAAQKRILEELDEKERLLQNFYRRTRSHIFALEEMLKIRAREMKSEEGTRAILESLSRLSGIRLLYDRLLEGSQTQSSPVQYLEALGHSLLSANGYGGRISIVAEIQEIDLTSNQLLGIGAVTIEFLEQSLKEAFLHRTRGSIRLILEKAGQDIMLTISDDGERWSLETWERGSDAFGLSVILMVAERLGGSIGVEPDRGNRLVFRFPVQEPTAKFREGLAHSPHTQRFKPVLDAVRQIGRPDQDYSV